VGLNFKVLDGTKKSGKNLCLSCGHMSRRIGQNNEDEIVCGSYKFQSDLNGASLVHFKVAECSEYRPFNQQTLKDMYESAWVVQARKKGPAGFQLDPSAPKTADGEEETVIEIVPPKKRKDDDDED
jgi:hypothetical protein